MKIYLVRHGQSKNNALRLHQHGGIPLSKYGLEQANRVGRRFKKIPVEIVISSDFTRARQTAEIINKYIDKPIVFCELAQERKRPSFMEDSKRFDDAEVIKIKAQIRNHLNDPLWHYSDEENFFDFKIRISKFIKFLTSRSERNVLVVTHGMTITMTAAMLMFGENLSSNLFNQFTDFMRVRNTGITIIERKNDKWRLITWNDQTHLG
jgi:broad specificity phosphatase PhoE